ncbi:hypothetical protein [Asticcacaulis benevestitus]|uniref:DUF4142 domain-containing protein n=1 Tax=Asticcacaulis benevestitus DSM 16100 = ATCC BAA-896 TaxID=1121022 RepID=V4PT24_9CAUL|nr:hypothetical protein [Asticcacaulis benevestitus]ESQ88670.1 hypothetical protein ABENE_15625 [Asticcacaulis benevestitus DSM 16100 = ATCC BAA-896]
MNRKLIALVLLATISASPAVAQNPFSQMKQLGDSLTGKGSSNNSVVDSVDIYASFLAARLEMNNAQLSLANAFDLKDQVTLLQAEQTRLQSGAIDADGIKKSTVLSNNVSTALNEKMGQKTALSAEGRHHFEAAIPHLLLGTIMTVRLIVVSKSALSSASFADKIPLALVAKDIPGLAKTTYENYKMVLTYGKENNIPMPSNASDALGSL